MSGIRSKSASLVLAALLAGGCASVSHVPEDDQAARDCLELWQALDAAVESEGVRDAQSARIEGFPHLRIDRFLDAFRAHLRTDDQRAEWRDRLSARGRQDALLEWQRLGPEPRAALAGRAQGDLPGTLARCDAPLRVHDLAPGSGLTDAAEVPEHYATWQRVVGVYAVTAMPMAVGVTQWHAEVRSQHAVPVARLLESGRWVRYLPPEAERKTAPPVVDAPRSALGIPRISAAQQTALFARHAPTWLVDTRSLFDRIGRPYWPRGAAHAQVETGDPVVYRHLSHALWDGEVVLQLNYVLWFPGRPADGWFDILAGHLDGITWRVTVDASGAALAYDAMHNCGCWHLFYPTDRVLPRHPPDPRYAEERAFAPQVAPAAPEGRGVTLLVSSRAHALQRVLGEAPAAPEDVVYRFDDYDALRALPAGEGVRSLFGPEGLVAGTERGERFLFWPMGIASPGAMRQWGTHATAFIGRRHFDDPWLMERAFVRRDR